MNFNKNCIQKGHELENTLGFCFHQDCQSSPEFCFLCLEECQLKHYNDCFRFLPILQAIKSSFEELEIIKKQIYGQRLNILECFLKFTKCIEKEQEILSNLFNLLNNKNYDQVKQNLDAFSQFLNHQKELQFKDSMDQIIQKCDEISKIVQQKMDQYQKKGNSKFEGEQFSKRFSHEHQYENRQSEVNYQLPQENQETVSKEEKYGLQGQEKYQLGNQNQNDNQCDQANNLIDEQEIKKSDDDAGFAFQKILIAENLVSEASSLFFQMEFKKTIKILEQSLQYDKDNEETYFLLSTSLLKIGQLKEAYAHVIKCIQLKPNYLEAFHIKGQILLAENKFQEALESFKVAQNCPQFKNSELYITIGIGLPNQKARILLELRNFNEALKYCDLTIADNQLQDQAYNLKAIAQERLCKFEEAKQSINLALLYNPENPVYQNNKGFLLHRIGEFEEALTFFNKALLQKRLLRPEVLSESKKYQINQKALENKLQILLSFQKFDDALKCINEMIEDEPKNNQLYNQKIQILNNLGRKEEADQIKEFISLNLIQ